MPRHASDNLAETFAKILCERASFELKEEDVNAYRQHISSLQQAAQFTAAARANEEEEYRQWVVSKLTNLVHAVLRHKTPPVTARPCSGTAHTRKKPRVVAGPNSSAFFPSRYRMHAPAMQGQGMSHTQSILFV